MKGFIGAYFLALALPAVMQQLRRDSFSTPRQIVFGNTALLCMSSQACFSLPIHKGDKALLLILTLLQTGQSYSHALVRLMGRHSGCDRSVLRYFQQHKVCHTYSRRTGGQMVPASSRIFLQSFGDALP